MLHKIIATVVFISFLYVMIFMKGNRNEHFIQFILIIYPFLSIDLFPAYFSLRLFDFITLIFYILFYKKTVNIESYPKIIQAIKYLLLLILASSIFRIIIQGEWSKSLAISIIQILSLVLFTKILFQILIFNSQYISKVQNLFSYLVIFSLLFLVMQFVFGTTFTISKSPNINVEGGIAIRYPSFFQDPQKYGQFLAAASYFILLQYFSSILENRRIILFILASVALLYTGARAPMIGWIISFLLFLIFIPVRKKYLFLPFLFISLFAVYQYADNIPIFNRASMDDSYSFRNDIWHVAISIFQDYPLSGIGYGNYSNFVEYFHPDQFWIADNDITYFDHPESGYLKLLVEFGLLGFLPLIVIVCLLFYSGFLQYYFKQNILSALLGLSFLTWVVGFTTVYSLGDIRICVLMVIIATSNLSISFHNKQYILE